MRQIVLENAILATIVYYDVLGNYPLTAFEIYKYLTNLFPDNSSDSQELKNIQFSQIIDILTKSQGLKKTISQKNGFYFLKNQEEIVEKRIERQKIAERKWKKLRKIVRWFQILPYVQMIAVSGSLALNNTKKESDLDLLISARYGRVWMVRLFLSGLTQLIGQRRHGQVIKDKICLNQYLTSQHLRMPIQNLSNAHSIARLVPLLGIIEYQRLLKSNDWTKNYLPRMPANPIPFFGEGIGLPPAHFHLRAIKENKFLKLISKLAECLLDAKFGDILGKKLGQWQKRKIIRKTRHASITFTLDEIKRKNSRLHLYLSEEALIFHYPISRNLEVQIKYEAALKKYL